MNRSAGVLPVVGDAKKTPACTPPLSGRKAALGKYVSPAISSPVHSAHAAANAASSSAAGRRARPPPGRTAAGGQAIL